MSRSYDVVARSQKTITFSCAHEIIPRETPAGAAIFKSATHGVASATSLGAFPSVEPAEHGAR